MPTPPKIAGIHHLTAVSSSASENVAFYTDLLGLRLVKQTVNFDDPFTYHLYYGANDGAPGTILTFFPWEDLPPGRPGAGMVTAIALAIPLASIDFWANRLTVAGLQIATDERFGEPVLRLKDLHGLPIELIGSQTPLSVAHWPKSPIDKRHAITGFHSATATLRSSASIKNLLVEQMGLRPAVKEHNRIRFEMADRTAPGHLYDVLIDPQAPTGRPGSGTVHHIAFRTDSDAAQQTWQSSLRQAGFSATDVRDRKYFRSIYFRSPGGVLFEIATDQPGFAVDEMQADLGQTLKLPEELEPMRTEIERQLPRLRRDDGMDDTPLRTVRLAAD
jgi:glyoxalase family protein